jgi:hypothetical protein
MKAAAVRKSVHAGEIFYLLNQADIGRKILRLIGGSCGL